MINREKVIRHIAAEISIARTCKKDFASVDVDMLSDALSLLKEREAVVHPEPSCEMTYITNCCCDLCGVQLIREDNFCRCCGKRIEWEGR